MVRATKPVTLHEHDDEALFCGCCICNLRSSKAEVEKIERKMTAHRETAVAAIAGTEKACQDLRVEVERLRAALEGMVRAYAQIGEDERSATAEDIRRVPEVRAAYEALDRSSCHYDYQADASKPE